MNTVMTWRLLAPFWNTGEGGGGGGAGDGGSGGEGGGESGSGAGEGGQGDGGQGGGASTPDWREGLSDDDKKFVGDRDVQGLVDYAKSQRDGASKRVDDVIKAEGLVKVPAKDAEVGDFFQQFRPETADTYGETIGKKGDNVSASDKIDFEAAHAADMHPDQYRRFTEKQAELRQTADKEAADKMVADLTKDWGADFESGMQAVDRAAKALGMDADSDFTKALSSPGMGATTAEYRAIMEGLRKIGTNMKEGDGVGDGGAGDTQTAQEQLDALEQEIIAKGGKATPDQQRRQTELIALVAQEKGKAA